MNSDLRLPLTISVAFHLILFAAITAHFRRDIYVNIPVQLMFYNPPAAAVTELPLPKKSEDIVMPKKAVQKEEPKKAEAPAEQNQAPRPAEPGQPANPLTLDQARFHFGYYTNIVIKSVNRNWQYSSEFESLRSVIYFQIQRNGDLDKVEIEQSSGDPLFDQLALRAVKLSAPFPPLPEGYGDNYLGVHFEFKHH
jgi:TonB family protein